MKAIRLHWIFCAGLAVLALGFCAQNEEEKKKNDPIKNTDRALLLSESLNITDAL